MKTVFSIFSLVAAGLWSAIVPTNAQVNVIEGGPNGPMIIAVTESNNVYALNAVNGTIIWQRIADAHRDDGKRFVVPVNERVTAFMQLESAICACDELS